MRVWNDWNKYIQVHTRISLYMTVLGLYQTYILVHTGTSLWHERTYFDQLVPAASAPGWPAWKQRICCFEKIHQFIHTHVYSSLVLTICPPVSACQWGQGESAGSGQVRCPPCTARSSALQASLQSWCNTDASRSPFHFYLVSRVRTTIVGPAGQHASICQMRHGFSHQQTSKSTTWK